MFIYIQLLKNSNCPCISAKDLVLISLKTPRIRSPIPYRCCGAKIIPAWDKPCSIRVVYERQKISDIAAKNEVNSMKIDEDC